MEQLIFSELFYSLMATLPVLFGTYSTIYSIFTLSFRDLVELVVVTNESLIMKSFWATGFGEFLSAVSLFDLLLGVGLPMLIGIHIWVSIKRIISLKG